MHRVLDVPFYGRWSGRKLSDIEVDAFASRCIHRVISKLMKYSALSYLLQFACGRQFVLCFVAIQQSAMVWGSIMFHDVRSFATLLNSPWRWLYSRYLMLATYDMYETDIVHISFLIRIFKTSFRLGTVFLLTGAR